MSTETNFDVGVEADWIMVLKIQNKVALITGGASGLRFIYAKELLCEGAKVNTLN